MSYLCIGRIAREWVMVLAQVALLAWAWPLAGAEKLDVPELTVEQSQAEYDARQQQLLERLAGGERAAALLEDPAQDVYGDRAIANLMLGRHVELANERLRGVADWFHRPHPRGREPEGECDFAALKLCRAYYMFEDADGLESETREAIERFFLREEFESWHASENHKLIFYTARHLMGQALPAETFEAYGRSGRELAETDRQWLVRFLRFRAQQGWGEFDSTAYVGAVWKALTALHDFSDDDELRDLAHMMMDLVLADTAVDSLHGLHGGAKGRTKNSHVRDHGNGATYALQYLYFGNVDEGSLNVGLRDVGGLATSYRPAEIVVNIALDRREPYVNRERKHLHNLDDVMPREPLPGSIRKYTHWTPRYVLGAVQRQDAYPEDHGSRWYAGHQQQDWDLTIGTRSTARMFTHHPGDEAVSDSHSYWVGDTRCNCSDVFQHKDALVALYDIGEDQPYQWIHAYLPRESFDEIVEEDGIIFVREGDVVAALVFVRGYEWTGEGRWQGVEVISEGSRQAVVCEVAPLSEVGTFEAFREQIHGNAIAFDRESMTLSYDSQRNGRLRIDTDGLRERDGQAVDLDYPTYDSPYLRSEWGSGVVHLSKGERRMELDFQKAERTAQRVEGEVDD